MRKKILLILFSTHLFCINGVIGQKKLPNKLIGKNEIEFNVSILGSQYAEISPCELIYRWPVSKNIKIGAGAKLFLGEKNYPDYHLIGLHPAIFFDAALFVGKLQRQKWSINLQAGYDFYRRIESDFASVDNGGAYLAHDQYYKGSLYSTLGGYHRAIISHRFQLLTGGFISFRKISYTGIKTYASGSRSFNIGRMNFGGGVKIGMVIGLWKKGNKE